jgi:hypothetical protein
MVRACIAIYLSRQVLPNRCPASPIGHEMTIVDIKTSQPWKASLSYLIICKNLCNTLTNERLLYYLVLVFYICIYSE